MMEHDPGFIRNATSFVWRRKGCRRFFYKVLSTEGWVCFYQHYPALPRRECCNLSIEEFVEGFVPVTEY
jgi:hypothetical protein